MTSRPVLAPDTAAVPRPSARMARVAEILDCDESDVRRLIDAGHIQAHSIGIRGIRVYLDSVAAYQEGRNRAPRAAKHQAVKAQRDQVSRAASSNSEAALRKSGILP